MSLMFHAFLVSLPTRVSPSECLPNVSIGYGMARPHISPPRSSISKELRLERWNVSFSPTVLYSYQNRQFCIYLSIYRSIKGTGTQHHPFFDNFSYPASTSRSIVENLATTQNKQCVYTRIRRNPKIYHYSLHIRNQTKHGN